MIIQARIFYYIGLSNTSKQNLLNLGKWYIILMSIPLFIYLICSIENIVFRDEGPFGGLQRVRHNWVTNTSTFSTNTTEMITPRKPLKQIQ